MKFEREAGIHLHAPVRRWQPAAGRHLIDVGDRQTRLEAFRQPVKIAMGDSDELAQGAPFIGRLAVIDVTLLVDCAPGRDS